MARRHAFALAGALLAPPGCGAGPTGPPPSFAMCPPGADAGSGVATPAAPDYWHDVKPILDARCATCHSAGGIGPFALLTYQDASSSALLIEGAVSSRKMPPWPPNDCCQTYRHDRSLAQSELDILLRWLDAGTPEGDPQGAPPSMPPPAPMLSRVDTTLRMPEAFTPVAQEASGERRCFLIEDWPFDTDKFVTGLDARPGNRAVVQHVLVQTVDPGDLPDLRARQGLDGRPGFDCGGVSEEIQLAGFLGNWTPGQPPFESADATVGVPIPAHASLMLQVLYDVTNGVMAPDQTEIDFQVADTVAHAATGMVVDSTTRATTARSYFVLSVDLRMSSLDSRGRLAVHRKGGTWDCLLDIPSWDYRWGSDYEFVEPVRVDPGDQLYVECQPDACAGVMLSTDTWP